MTIQPRQILIETANSWDAIESWIDQRGGTSIFRGQFKASWNLRSNLERALDQAGIPLSASPEIEKNMIRRFQREARQYLTHIPDKHNIPEWLALMQHHGAPTRLLDWSHSALVALFFAVCDQLPPTKSHDGAGDEEPLAALFAIDWEWIDQQLPQVAKDIFNTDRNLRGPGQFYRMCRETTGILKLNSFCSVPRQSVQQGTFLLPPNANFSFEENLHVSLSRSADPRIFKLQIPFSLRKDVLERLYRRNMHAATLYPGLDGYAQSIRSMLAVDHLLTNRPLT